MPKSNVKQQKKHKEMKKIKEPNLKVIKFEKMDVIATSGEQRMAAPNTATIYFENNVSSWR